MKPSLRSLAILVAVLSAVLVVLFHKSFSPDQALFSNDAPIGAQMARPYALPDAFFGIWNDLYWLGLYNGNYAPNFTGIINSLPFKMARVNFYAPLSALVLGICAWIFFRRLGANSRVAILAALAAALNMNFFSNAGWGLGSRGLSLAAIFLALAAIEMSVVVQPWLCSIVAGLAIGLSITEGGDNGAIFSMFVGVYAFWRTVAGSSARGKGAALGAAKVVVMVVFAAVMASQTLDVFVRSAVKGIAGTQQDTETKAQKWDFATQWSLPKIEMLRVIIPGIFGYRMDTPDGGAYWGRVGEAPGHADQMPRYSGAGEYAGVLVMLIGLWAIVEAFRKKAPIFTDTERKLILFWAASAVVAMALGWGRHAPFYKIVYALPYFSTIRNPMKFMHAFHLCFMILFAYGLIGLNRRYLDVPTKATSLFEQLRLWWTKGPSHEKLWTWGCIVALGISVVAWFGYSGSRSAVVKHLMSAGFPDSATATAIAKFSANEVFLFVVFLAVSVAIVTLIISGAFSGHRDVWAAVLLGVVVVVDLARANAPWIIYYPWKEKYATNAVLDVLKDKPYEHRVSVPDLNVLVQLPLSRQYFMADQRGGQMFQFLARYYHVEWLQHHVPFYNIQALDMPQEPRMPLDKQAFLGALGGNLARKWELTNTRFLLGGSGNFVEMLNQQFDPVKRRFRTHTQFQFTQKPDTEYYGVQPDTNGLWALIEFTGALPRAQLYSNWETFTNETALLARFADPSWDPAQSVLMLGEAPKPTGGTAQAGKAEILANPSPKLMEVQTTSDAPAMLLLNDKIDPEWKAYIDGKSAPVLRANYLMRGVHVPAGTHKVTFRYEMQANGFWLVLACDLVGLLLVGIIAWSASRKRAATTAPA